MPTGLQKRRRSAFLILAATCFAASLGAERMVFAADDIRGTPIAPVTPGVPAVPPTNIIRHPAATNPPVAVRGKYQPVGFDRLSAFPYDVVEITSTNAIGRPLTRSTNTIPAEVRKLNNQAVSVTGFVLPLRTKKGRVIEFLLMRDLSACCFGATPQMNHWIRVKSAEGFIASPMVPATVSGTLQVGEVFESGYLTGIYRLTADRIAELGER